ncbi:MAG: hypothetical protein ACKVPJ_09665 [Chitinophagales bacterium]
MKKISLTFLVLCFMHLAHAQTASPHALGIRLGGSDGASGEISFQTFIGGSNRLEMDLGFIDAGWFNGYKFSLLYHWVGNIGNGFYWYIGAGGSIGSWKLNDEKPGNDTFHNDGFFLDADGQLGIEYYFPIPIQISLDLRPEFGLINDDFDMGFGLGIRYCF